MFFTSFFGLGETSPHSQCYTFFCYTGEVLFYQGYLGLLLNVLSPSIIALCFKDLMCIVLRHWVNVMLTLRASSKFLSDSNKLYCFLAKFTCLECSKAASRSEGLFCSRLDSSAAASFKQKVIRFCLCECRALVFSHCSRHCSFLVFPFTWFSTNRMLSSSFLNKFKAFLKAWYSQSGTLSELMAKKQEIQQFAMLSVIRRALSLVWEESPLTQLRSICHARRIIDRFPFLKHIFQCQGHGRCR